MKTRLRDCLSGVCKAVLTMRGYRSHAIYVLMDWYCTGAGCAINLFQQNIEAGIDGFAERRESRIASFKSAVEEAKKWQLTSESSAGLLNPVQRASIQGRAFALIDALEFNLLKASTRSARVSVTTLTIALAVWRAERRTHHASYHALASIFRVETPILEWELLLWLATNPMYAEEALGDLREGYEARIPKYGEGVARRYVRNQVIRDIRTRIARITGAAALATKFLHWLHQHSRSK